MKNPLFSKTIQGILLLVLPQVLSRLGFKLDDAGLQGIAEDLCLIAGAVWSIYGRVTATEPLRNPLASSKLPLAVLASGLGSGVLGLGTGCNTLSDSQRAALVDAGKLAAKVALQLGLGELSQRVNELQPYAPKLGLLIETTFSPAASGQRSAVSPEAIGAQLKAHVLATIPPEHQAAVLEQLQRSAVSGQQSASAASPHSPSPIPHSPPPPPPDFRTRLAAALQ